MTKILLASLFATMIGQATAAETLLKADAMRSILTDVLLYGTSNGQPAEQIFQKSGVTFYSAGGNQSQGAWKIQGDKYCSQWPPNQAWVCYDVARDGNKITFVSTSGQRTEMSLTK